MLGVFFLAVLYLQRVLGYDAIADRRRVPAVSLAIGVALARLLGAAERPLRPEGGAAGRRSRSIAGGLALLSQVPVDGRYVADLLPAMLLLGVGGGLAFPALMTLAMSGATPEDSGLASGLVNTTQQVGGALGLAVLASVVADAHGRRDRGRGARRRLQRRVHGRGRARRRGARRRRARPARPRDEPAVAASPPSPRADGGAKPRAL